METKTKEIQVYIAKDGKEFINEEECLHYEDEVLKVLDKMKFFYSYHSPDLTEGRGFYGETYFAIYDPTGLHQHRALEYLVSKYKQPIEYVQGCAAIINYSIPTEILKSVFNAKAGTKESNKTITKILISPQRVEGFPKPYWTK